MELNNDSVSQIDSIFEQIKGLSSLAQITIITRILDAIMSQAVANDWSYSLDSQWPKPLEDATQSIQLLLKYFKLYDICKTTISTQQEPGKVVSQLSNVINPSSPKQDDTSAGTARVASRRSMRLKSCKLHGDEINRSTVGTTNTTKQTERPPYQVLTSPGLKQTAKNSSVLPVKQGNCVQLSASRRTRSRPEDPEKKSMVDQLSLNQKQHDQAIKYSDDQNQVAKDILIRRSVRARKPTERMALLEANAMQKRKVGNSDTGTCTAGYLASDVVGVEDAIQSEPLNSLCNTTMDVNQIGRKRKVEETSLGNILRKGNSKKERNHAVEANPQELLDLKIEEEEKPSSSCYRKKAEGKCASDNMTVKSSPVQEQNENMFKQNSHNRERKERDKSDDADEGISKSLDQQDEITCASVEKHKCYTTRCPVCKDKFYGNTSLKKHMKNHDTSPEIKCGYCDKAFFGLTDMRKHQFSEHGMIMVFRCPHCKEVAATAKEMKAHLKTTHPEEDFTAISPDLHVDTVEAKQYPNLKLSGVLKEVHQCPHCDYSNVNITYLKGHIMQHHTGERPHLCDTCGLGFTMAKHLARHKAIHEEKVFLCEHCNFRTHTSHLLYAHKFHRHNTARPKFTCNVCQTVLLNANSLKVHMRSHSGHRPYICSVCGKSFSCSSLLAAHRRCHAAPTERCEHCGKMFKNQSKLRLHMNIHTGERNYHCPHCTYAAYSKDNLRKHCLGVHKVEFPLRNRTRLVKDRVNAKRDGVPKVNIELDSTDQKTITKLNNKTKDAGKVEILTDQGMDFAIASNCSSDLKTVSINPHDANMAGPSEEVEEETYPESDVYTLIIDENNKPVMLGDNLIVTPDGNLCDAEPQTEVIMLEVPSEMAESEETVYIECCVEEELDNASGDSHYVIIETSSSEAIETFKTHESKDNQNN